MSYQIRKYPTKHDYSVFEVETNSIVKEDIDLDEANKLCWQNKDPLNRYQILANAWAVRHELTWYCEEEDILIPNGYATMEEARLAIVEDLQELCLNNDYATHPNPEGDYSIIDTFTGEEIDYSISEEEAKHPDPDFKPEN